MKARKTTKTIEVVKQLQEQGFKIEFVVRSDGGIKITKINGVSYKGSSGNMQARKLAGVELTQAQLSQRKYNVTKYIKGKKKPKDKVQQDIKKKVRDVQRAWRKNKVNGKVTMTKVRWHLKHGGKKKVIEYLSNMERYGKGIAYEDNVRWLANYTNNVAMGLSLNGYEDVANKYIALADYMLSIIDRFKEAWINPIYDYLYEIRDNGYNGALAEGLLPTIYNIMR